MLFALVIVVVVILLIALVTLAFMAWGVAWGFFTIVAILFAFSAAWNTFVTKELLKKFGFMAGLVWARRSAAGRTVKRWTYSGYLKPGMYTLELSTDIGLEVPPWGVTGFVELDLPFGMPGMDPFFHVYEGKPGPIYVKAWLGEGEVDFLFVANYGPIYVRVVGDDSTIEPDFVATPHWWQRLGFYG